MNQKINMPSGVYTRTEEMRKNVSFSKLGCKYPNRKLPSQFSKEHRRKMSLAKMGNKCCLGIKRTEKWKKQASERMKGNTLGIGKNIGSQNVNWKGGITPINEKIRKSLEYKLWRTSVFERDNYTCVWCGDNKGGNLNVDHIKPFALYPELRFELSNGRTLCVDCHRKTDSYGFQKGYTPWNKIKINESKN